MQNQQRISKVERKTKEVGVNVTINLDGNGISHIKTNIAFLDHIIESFSKHSKIDITLTANSQDNIVHHLIEDIGISLGQAINLALGDRKKITRFGNSSVPMDESISNVAIDLIKRPYYYIDLKLKRESTEGIIKEDMEHFFNSFIGNMNCCIHMVVEYGANDHHKIESTIKSFAIALKQAIKISPNNDDEPTTKGMM